MLEALLFKSTALATLLFLRAALGFFSACCTCGTATVLVQKTGVTAVLQKYGTYYFDG